MTQETPQKPAGSFEEKMASGAGNTSFADLFAQNEPPQKRLAPGQQVEARIVRLGKEWTFLDFGGKSEGCLASSELVDKDGTFSVKQGDTIRVYFLSARRNEMLFTSKASGKALSAHLEEIYASGIPVEGFVAGEIKGGFQVTLAGGVRAFCPYSQMDVRRVQEAAAYVGQHHTFRISELSESGRNVVLSRRALLLEEQEQRKEDLQQTLQVGNVVKGTITSLRDFGAFVDIGGLEGLIPISEIGWGQVDDIHSGLEIGQEVQVAVLKLDWENNRYSFSLRATMPDPWLEAPQRFPEGSSHTGTVSRLTTFGAFVTLAPGIDGLLHISALGGGRKLKHPREVVQQGQSIQVKIEKLDLENKRLSLVPVDAGSAAGKGANAAEQERAEYQEYLTSRKPSVNAGQKSGLGTLGDLLQKQIKGGK
jgi:small subunit ribosomal protein S1